MKYELVESQLGDWAPKLKPFIESPEFDKIFKFLKDQTREGKTICPKSSDLFRSFRETPYKKLRCILILQDPYPWIKDGKYVADGIPMSCRNTGICQPSLDLFYGGIEDDLGVSIARHPDLTYLANQGVLLLNNSLTVELNKPGSHKEVWNDFMMYLVNEVINYYTYGVIYVSLGKNAQALARAMVPFLHWGFEVEHPAAAAHRGGVWDHQKIFTKIGKILKDCNNEQIIWDYAEYKRKSEQLPGEVRSEVSTEIPAERS